MTHQLFRFLAILCLIVGMIAASGCKSATASVSIPDPAVYPPLAARKGKQKIVLAGGCFWGIPAVFQHVKGVIKATSGYSGGEARTAEYELVSSGRTGHAESVQVIYDPSQISYG